MWEVRLSQGVEDAYVSHPSGCSCLFNRDVTTCLLTELLSNSRYTYQVKEVCTDDRRSGDFLNVGMVSSLFDVAAPPTIALGLKNMSSTWLDIDFVGAGAGCEEAGSQFLHWQMEYRSCDELGKPWKTVVSPSCVLPDGVREDLQPCILESLTPGKTYQARLKRFVLMQSEVALLVFLTEIQHIKRLRVNH